MRAKQFIREFSEYDNSITNVLQEKGYEFLGGGVDQRAFLEPGTGQVLKIFGTKSGTGTNKFTPDQEMFIYWAKYCAAYEHNPILPKFSGWETFDWKGSKYLQIRMERLGPLSSAMADALAELAHDNRTFNSHGNPVENEPERLQQINKRKQQQGNDDRPAIRKDEITNKYTLTQEPHPTQIAHNELILLLGRDDYNKLLRTLEDLNKIALRKKWRLDLHSGNFMMRDDSTPVIVDPWVIAPRNSDDWSTSKAADWSNVQTSARQSY